MDNMEEMFNNKINLLKALAIILVVSGHLGMSLVPFFPTYSFHMALFFFISGYLFKDKHLLNIFSYVKIKARKLLLPYLMYSIVYFVITLIVAKITGIYYWDSSVKKLLLRPLLNGSFLAFITPLWFVLQLFISLTVFAIVYKCFKKIQVSEGLILVLFLSFTVLSMQYFMYNNDIFAILLVRTLFSVLFIYFGYFYQNFTEKKYNLFTANWILAIITFQALLWLFNPSSEPRQGMAVGLDYMLVNADFPNCVIPILTSITGIWASLFIVKAIYPYVKDNKFLEQIGKNTYYIMANHLFIIYLISNFFLFVKKLPASARINDSIFWIYSPYKTTFLYLILAVTISTGIGVSINILNKKLRA